VKNPIFEQFVADWKRLPVGALFRLEPIEVVSSHQSFDKDVLKKLGDEDAVSVDYPDQFYPMGIFAGDHRIVEVK
jgi:hypothetical protein